MHCPNDGFHSETCIFRGLFENAVDPVLIADDDRVYIAANQAACDFYGVPKERLLGMRVDDFTAPGTDVEAAWNDFIASGTQKAEITLKCGTGEIRHVEFSATANFSPGLHVSVLRDITRRKRTEAELQVLTAHLADVLNSTTDCVFSVDQDWRFTYLNERAATRLRLGSQVLGRKLWDVFPDAIHTAAYEHANKALRTQMPEHFEFYFGPLAGWFEVHAYPSADGLAVFFRDVTERKDLEHLLAQERERLDLVMRANNDGIWDCDLVSGRVLVSPRWREVFGYTEEDVPRTVAEWRARIHPDDLPKALYTLDEHCANRSDVYNIELRFQCRDGSYRWVLSRAIAVRNDRGTAVRLVGSHTDITNERKAADHIRRQAAILDQIQHSVIATTHDGHIIEWNQGSTRVFGYSEAEMLGRHVSWLSEDPEQISVLLDRGRDAGATAETELTLRRKSGERIHVAISCSSLRDSAGQLLGLIVYSQDVTDRHRAQEALRVTEQRLKTARELANIGFFEWDLSKPAAVCSEEYYRLYGLRPNPNGLSYADWLQHVHPDDRDRVDRQAREALQYGGTSEKEFRVVLPDGSVRWVSDKAIVVHNEHGCPSHFVGFVSDITARKDAEEQLRSSERYFRSLIDNALDVTTVLEHDGAIRYQSPSVHRVLGYDPAELTGRSVLSFIHPRDLDTALRVFQSGTVQAGATESRTLRFRHRDGSWRIFEVLVSNLLHDSAVRGIVLNARDATERARAEQRIRMSEERLAAAQEKAHLGHWERKVNSDELHWSREIYRIFGFEEGSRVLVGDVIRAVHPDDREVFAETAYSAALNRKPFQVDYRIVRPDGSVRFVSTTGEFTLDEHGIECLTGTIQDVTRRRELEQQLHQAQKMEAIGRLAGGVAHDFNNLLTIILGYANLIEKKLESTSPFRPKIAGIRQAGERAASLTQQLLAFSRKQLLQPKLLSLNDIVTTLDPMLSRLIGEHIDYTTTLDANLSQIRADPAQLDQVIINLVVNARDAMPDRGKISIETHDVILDARYAALRSLPPGRYALLTISDSGAGMDTATQSRIFEPFFTTKEQGKGTGLGLSTVHGIVEQTGGRIVVYSGPQRGTTFKIYFPAYRPAEVSLEPEQRTVTQMCRPGRILVIDDEPGVRNLIRAALASAGHTVVEAKAVSDTLRNHSDNVDPFDVVIVGLTLRDQVTSEAFTELKARTGTERLLYTSTSEKVLNSARAAISEGAAVLAKPFTEEMLLASVNHLFVEHPHFTGSVADGEVRLLERKACHP